MSRDAGAGVEHFSRAQKQVDLKKIEDARKRWYIMFEDALERS